MKATEQYFAVMLFIMLYKVVLTVKSVDEIFKCDHSKEPSSSALLGAIHFMCFLFGFFSKLLR